jgi:hypothetical protein
MDYGVSFQHLTLLGADAPSGSGDLSFSSENPASWPSGRGGPAAVFARLGKGFGGRERRNESTDLDVAG